MLVLHARLRLAVEIACLPRPRGRPDGHLPGRRLGLRRLRTPISVVGAGQRKIASGKSVNVGGMLSVNQKRTDDATSRLRNNWTGAMVSAQQREHHGEGRRMRI